jgi:hypothetical protein
VGVRSTDAHAIRVAKLKAQPAAEVVAGLKKANKEGVRHLTVLNREIPILHLGWAEELPSQWQTDDLATHRFSDLKQGRISLVGLRRSQRAMLLNLRSGPKLALWPYAGPSDGVHGNKNAATPVSMATETAELRRRLKTLETRLASLEQSLAIMARMNARLFDLRQKYNLRKSHVSEKKVGTE